MMPEMSPTMVIFAVRALIRLGAAARASYEQHLRDSEVLMPLPEKIALDPITPIRAIAEDDRFKKRFSPGGDLEPYWDADKKQPRDNEDARKNIIQAVELIWETELAMPSDVRTTAGGALTGQETGHMILKQWAEGAEPPPPIARVVLALAEVVLEFAGTNPSILGAGTSGEKLITTLSENIWELLPDADNPEDWKSADWAKFYFAQRAMAIFLHAGLKTITENPDVLIESAEYRALVHNVLMPLVKTFEQDPEKVPSLIIFRDTLFGPMAKAAFKTLAEHQEAFFGARFSDSKAVGALTRVLFDTVAEASGTDVRNVFGNEGLVQLYKAVLGVMVRRPELFVGSEESAEATLKGDLFKNIAQVLQASPPPFNKELAAPLAIAALDALGSCAAASLGDSNPWEAVAGASIDAFIGGIKDGLKTRDMEWAFAKILSREQMIGFAKIFFQQVAKTPGMLFPGSASKELKHVVGAVANAMAHHAAKLMSGEDWLVIAQVAAEEAAKNPARLFRIDIVNPEAQLANILIKTLLQGAADSFGQDARRDGKVVFGETLRYMIVTSLQAAAGNIEGATKHADEIAALEKRINKLASDKKERIGMREAKVLFEKLIVSVIDDGKVTLVRSGQPISVPIGEMTDDELMEFVRKGGIRR
jgi:hypothetical protein